MLAATAEVRFEEEALLELNHLSAARYGAFVERLEADSGERVDYRQHGSLVVALDRDDHEALERLLAYQRSKGLEAERLSGTEARELEPALAPGVHGAVFCPRDHQVDPRRLSRALEVAFRRAGGVLREGVTVERLETGRAERVTGVTLHGGELIEADRVVLAAGAWIRKIGGVAKAHLPRVKPVRGQVIALQMEPGAMICERVVRAPDAYLVPRSSGELIVGATMEERGFDPRLTAGGVLDLLKGAWEAMPGIYDLAILDMWSGFRPISLHNEPILGPSPHHPGLWLAAGHGRNGVLLTPITSELLAESLLKGELHRHLAPFAPR